MLGRNILSMSGLSLYRNAVQFGMNIVIAAFVSPDQYGLIVFTTPFLVLIAMLTDLGMASAIVRMPTLTRMEAGAAWGAMLVGGGVCASGLALAAWPLQHAVHMPGLAPVMAGMAASIVLSVAATTPRALLERELRYGRVATVEAVATAVATVLGLAAAWSGAGVWSLVLYTIATHAARAGAFTWFARHRLSPNLRVREIAPLLSFGGWVLVTNLLNFLSRNSDNLLIGARLGAAAVGVYGLSYQFMLAPLMAITWPTSAILLATLREEDRTGPRAQAIVASVLSATALVSVPAMFYLTFGLAWPVKALLSPHWAPVPAIVAWLAPAGALQSLASYNGVLLLIAGRARAQFALTSLNTAVLLATFLIALPHGLPTLVHAYAIVVSVFSLAFLVLIASLTGLRWSGLARALGPAVLISATALATVRLTFGGVSAGWLRWSEETLLYALIVLGGYVLVSGHVRRTFGVLVARAPTPATET